jgi:hypothetical protein
VRSECGRAGSHKRSASHEINQLERLAQSCSVLAPPCSPLELSQTQYSPHRRRRRRRRRRSHWHALPFQNVTTILAAAVGSLNFNKI